MKAIITTTNHNGFKKGDIISWGSPCTEKKAQALSQALIDPLDPESGLLYGECQAVEGDREKIQVGDEFVDVDFRQAYTWNELTGRMELKNDSASRALIMQNMKFYAKSRIECTERKFKKMDNEQPKEKEKTDIDNASTEAEINTIVNSAIIGEPTDKEVKEYKSKKSGGKNVKINGKSFHI